ILERPIGRPQTMRTQLRHLAEAAESSEITIQVLPKSIGVTPGLEGSFSIFSLPEPIPDIGYTEGIGGGGFLDSVEDVRRCTLRFGMLIDQALPPGKSSSMIASAADRFD